MDRMANRWLGSSGFQRLSLDRPPACMRSKHLAIMAHSWNPCPPNRNGTGMGMGAVNQNPHETTTSANRRSRTRLMRMLQGLTFQDPENLWNAIYYYP